jgi:hypothetical protein
MKFPQTKELGSKLMKHSIIKCTRRQLQLLIRLICLTAAMLFFVLPAQSQHRIPRSLPEPVGGPGGSDFVARCPPGQFLAGVELRAGDDIDAIRPLCRTPSVHKEKVEIQPGNPKYNPNRYDQYEEISSFYVSAAAPSTGWYGGPGGSVQTVVCSPGAGGIVEPVVSAIYVEAEGVNTVTVNRITLLCEALTYGAPTQWRDREFWKDIHSDDRTVVNFEAPKKPFHEITGTSICPVSLDNLATIAVGIRGRSGVWLDAIGLICDNEKPPLPGLALGRVQSTEPAGPPRPICEVAQEARARNSPAAPGLEAQCRAARDKLPPVALGRVQSTTPKGPSMPICDRARDARTRNSPAAPGLEAQCRAFLAAKGAAIAESDPELAAARAADTDVLYRQGFDIATGIFGDPALGAQGNTAMGPGSQRIRDSLSAAGQKGFDAAVKVHLSRNYKA